jgi:hypothetical protein
MEMSVRKRPLQVAAPQEPKLEDPASMRLAKRRDEIERNRTKSHDTQRDENARNETMALMLEKENGHRHLDGQQ